MSGKSTKIHQRTTLEKCKGSLIQSRQHLSPKVKVHWCPKQAGGWSTVPCSCPEASWNGANYKESAAWFAGKSMDEQTELINNHYPSPKALNLMTKEQIWLMWKANNN